MDWKRPSDELGAYLERSLAGFNCQAKRMFGCPAYFVNGNMFTGVHGDSLFVRLGEPERSEALSASDEVSVFAPVPGRQMKEYVVLPDSVCRDDGLLRTWLRRSYAYASSLPAKQDKKGR